MTAALLSDLAAAGLTLAVDPPDTLVLRGPADIRARFLHAVRGHKGALLALLTAPAANAGACEAPAEPRRLWLIRHADGHVESHSFCPPASLTEVQGWYPAALAIEPEDPPHPRVRTPATAPAALSPAQPTPEPPGASCGRCAHYRPNPRGWCGIGRCRVGAPASLRPGSLWPQGDIHCHQYEAIQ